MIILIIIMMMMIIDDNTIDDDFSGRDVHRDRRRCCGNSMQDDV